MSLSASNPFAPRQYGRLEKVTPSVFIFRNITNSSFVIGDRSVAVIDTQVNRPSAEFLLQSIRSVTDKPVEFVINTHYHWDHTNGNRQFKDQGATMIASRLTGEFMRVRQDRQKEFLAGRGFELGDDPLLPEVPFEGHFEIDLGNQPLRLFFAGRAETDDATAVFVERERVLMSGDTIMTGSFPIFGQPVWDEGLQGDSQWMEAIHKLLSFKPAHIVPGHGPLAYETDVEKLLRIETFFIEEVKKRVEQGLDLAGILKDLEPALPRWITEMPIVWGTPRYAILRVFRGLTKKKGDPNIGWQHLKPSAIPEADPAALQRALAGKEREGDFFQMASEVQEGGDVGLKLAILKKCTELFPRSPESLSAYAEALIDASRAEASVLEKGDFFQSARQHWDLALSISPHHVASLLGKGRYLVMMAYRGGDDPRQGMRLLEKSLEEKTSPRTQAEAEFYIGMGYRRLGDETKALHQFQKALKADSAFMPAILAAGVRLTIG